MNVLTTIYHWIANNPWAVFFLYIMFNAFVGSLRAPTDKSGQGYVSLFAVLNAVAFNFGRMFPKVENSPNFQPAVNLQQKLAGQEPTPVVVPPKP